MSDFPTQRAPVSTGSWLLTKAWLMAAPDSESSLQTFCKEDFSSFLIRSLEPVRPCPAPWVLVHDLLDVRESHSLTAYLYLLPPPPLPVLCHTWATPLYGLLPCPWDA